MEFDFDKFDKEFDAMERKIDRHHKAMLIVAILWITFLIGCVGMAFFLVGRFMGVW